RDRHTRAAVCVTLVRPEFALQSSVVEDFLKRPRSLAAIRHACLPLVRVDSDDTGIPFVVEETIEGRNLSSLIDSFPQGLPPAMLSAVAVPLTEALALVHDHGLLHGRIDAEHVKLLGEAHTPRPKWLDVGAHNDGTAAQDPNYRAPESRTQGADCATPRADVFA